MPNPASRITVRNSRGVYACPPGAASNAASNASARGSSASGSRYQAEPAAHAIAGKERERAEHARAVDGSRTGGAQHHRQRAPSRGRVVRDVAMIVDCEHRRGEEPDRDAGEPTGRADRPGLHVDRAAHGHQSEEQEHRDVAERGVGDRFRPTHVGPRRDDRRGHDQRDGPAAVDHQRCADEERGDDRGDDRATYRRHRQPAIGRGARQARARARLAAAHGVADVVLHVADGLHEDRPGDGEDQHPWHEGAMLRPGERGADEHRHGGNGKGLRAQRDTPRGERAGFHRSDRRRTHAGTAS